MCSIMEKNSFLTDNELAMRNFANMCGITVDPNYYNDLAKTITSGCSNLKSDLLPKIQNFQGSRDY